MGIYEPEKWNITDPELRKIVLAEIQRQKTSADHAVLRLEREQREINAELESARLHAGKMLRAHEYLTGSGC